MAEDSSGGSGSVGTAGSPSCPVSWPTTGGAAGGVSMSSGGWSDGGAASPLAGRAVSSWRTSAAGCSSPSVFSSWAWGSSSMSLTCSGSSGTTFFLGIMLPPKNVFFTARWSHKSDVSRPPVGRQRSVWAARPAHPGEYRCRWSTRSAPSTPAG